MLLFINFWILFRQKGEIGFHPIHKDTYRFFWSLDSGFGIVEKKENQIMLSVLYGELELHSFEVETEHISDVMLNGAAVSFSVANDTICLENTVTIQKGQALCVNYCL